MGQGVRFVIAGGIVTVVYLTTTIALAELFGAPFQIALAAGFMVGIVAHFSLQRFFVWVHHEEFSLSLRDQLTRYLLMAGIQYGSTAVASQFLPGLLRVPVTVVFLGWTFSVTLVNFIVLRHGIFHAQYTKPIDHGA